MNHIFHFTFYKISTYVVSITYVLTPINFLFQDSCTWYYTDQNKSNRRKKTFKTRKFSNWITESKCKNKDNYRQKMIHHTFCSFTFYTIHRRRCIFLFAIKWHRKNFKVLSSKLNTNISDIATNFIRERHSFMY